MGPKGDTRVQGGQGLTKGHRGGTREGTNGDMWGREVAPGNPNQKGDTVVPKVTQGCNVTLGI